MSKKFKFYLQKYKYGIPRGKFVNKKILIEAQSSVHARRIVNDKFSDFEVSMFWPIWP